VGSERLAKDLGRRVDRVGGRVTGVVAWALGLLVLPSSSVAPSSRLDDSGYAATCLAVGAYVAPVPNGEETPLEAFAALDQAIGPLTMRRSFNPSLPVDFSASAAAGDAAAGLRSFVSWKPPGQDFRGAAAGRYDAEIVTWARSVPRSGVFATAYHEPENDMTGPEFVALHRHLYQVVTDANPTIRWGPVYMAYWWDPAEPDHYIGDPAEWWPGEEFADFVGVDWYGSEPEPMTASPSFRHWYAIMAPTGLPLFVVEYGQYELRPGEASDPVKEQARADAIRRDAAWIARHPRIVMWLYWQGPGPTGDWAMRDPTSQAAWREAASNACQP
jgi:hypothetical protein